MELDFPPFLMTSDPGSFAQSTILNRKPAIIDQVIEDNHFTDEINHALTDFKQEIVKLPLVPLHERTSDVDFWNQACAGYAGQTWLELPWYFAETFFYRKLLEATTYFQNGAYKGIDPFFTNKQRSLDSDIPWFEGELELFSRIEPELRFKALFYSSLWGNRADLSNFTVREKARSGQESILERHLILVDHTDQIERMLSKTVRRVDYITDNIGKELLFDLATANTILEKGWSQKVYFHLKDRPFFVSDATIVDTLYSINLLQKSQNGAVMQLGDRLIENLDNGQLVLQDSPFFTSYLMYRQMPEDLRLKFREADLIILKGDVNYRRLLDDRHWPNTTRMEQVTSYFPTSFVTLRTLKGEIMIDLGEGQAERLSLEEPDWLINGRRGVIRFVDKNQS